MIVVASLLSHFTVDMRVLRNGAWFCTLPHIGISSDPYGGGQIGTDQLGKFIGGNRFLEVTPLSFCTASVECPSLSVHAARRCRDLRLPPIANQ
jgi:hypothetical protein